MRILAAETWDHQRREQLALEVKYLETVATVDKHNQELAAVKAEHGVLLTKSQQQDAELERRRQQMIQWSEESAKEKEQLIAAKHKQLREVKVRLVYLRTIAEERRVCMEYASKVAEVSDSTNPTEDAANWAERTKRIADDMRITLEYPTPENVLAGRSAVLGNGVVVFIVEVSTNEVKGLNKRSECVVVDRLAITRVAKRGTAKRVTDTRVTAMPSSDSDDAPASDGKVNRSPPKKRPQLEGAGDGRGGEAAIPAMPPMADAPPAFLEGTH